MYSRHRHIDHHSHKNRLCSHLFLWNNYEIRLGEKNSSYFINEKDVSAINSFKKSGFTEVRLRDRRPDGIKIAKKSVKKRITKPKSKKV